MTAVGGVVDVAIHHRGIHAHPATSSDFVFTGDSHQAPMHLTEDLRPQGQRLAPQRLSIRHRTGTHMRQLAVPQTAFYLPLHIGKAPVKDMFERQQTQHHVGGHSRSAAGAASGIALGQGFVRQRYQLFIVQDPVQFAHPVFPTILQPLVEEGLGERGGRWRALITALARGSARLVIGAQGELVEFANGLQGLLELTVVAELAAHLGQLVAVQADLPVLAAGIIHVQDPLGVADAAGTFSAAFGVKGFAMKEGAAEDVAEVGDLGEETVGLWTRCAICTDGTMYHLYRWYINRPRCQDIFAIKCLEIRSVWQPAGQTLYGNEGVIPSPLRRKVATLFRRLRSEKGAPAGQF